jgi:uncharacterized membrane protein YfhO
MVKSDIRDHKFHFDDSMLAIGKIKAADHDLFFRIDKVYGSIKTGYNDGMVQDFYGTKSYQSHNHKGYVEFLDQAGVIDGSVEANTRWLVGVSATNILHGLFSIKYLLANESTNNKVDKAIYTPWDTAGSITIYKNNYYIPLGIPISRYMSTETYKQLSANEKRRAFYFTAVGEEDAVWKQQLETFPKEGFNFFGTAVKDETSALAGQAMKMDYFSSNRIKGSIDLNQPSMLFYSIPFDRGWHALVDDVEQPLTEINFGFTGLLLEPGQHVIELYYEPPLSRIGWFGWIFAGLGILALVRYKKYF